MTNKKLPNSDLSPAEIYRKYADIVSESMNDRLRYVHSKGKQYTGGVDDSGLSGTEYDPDTGDMHVRNASHLGQTHQELEKRGWKHTPNDREKHPAGGAQFSGDTDYRLGEAGMKEKTTVTLTVKDLLNALMTGTLVGKKITSVDWSYKKKMVDAGRGNAEYEKVVSGVTLGIQPGSVEEDGDSVASALDDMKFFKDIGKERGADMTRRTYDHSIPDPNLLPPDEDGIRRYPRKPGWKYD